MFFNVNKYLNFIRNNFMYILKKDKKNDKFNTNLYGGMVDALDLKSSILGCVGSSPTRGIEK